MLLRVDYADASDPVLAGVLGRLAFRGYSLELDGLPGPDFDLGLLDAFGAVEIDFATWTEAEITAALPRIRAHHARPMASGVGDHDQFAWAHAQGFDRFEGPFYILPRPEDARRAGIDRVALASLLRLQISGASIEQLNQTIGEDLGLSVKLLRYLNSAQLARRGTISSITQAVMMLGTRGVARWALLVALTTGAVARPEISRIALTRARLCESIANASFDGCETTPAADELFTIGMLSLADALLGVPLETALGGMPLTDEVRLALLGHEGYAGEILEAAIEYERGNFHLPLLQRHRTTLLDDYRSALRWAGDTVAAVC